MQQSKTIQELFNEIYLLNQKNIKNTSVLETLNTSNTLEDFNILLKSITDDNNKIKYYRMLIQEANFNTDLKYDNQVLKVYKIINIKEKLVLESKLLKSTIERLQHLNIDNDNDTHKTIMVLSQKAFELSNSIQEVVQVLNKFNNMFKIKI